VWLLLGAIIGDIVGSVYEWNNIKTKDFPLFTEKCFFTDDSVMTIAAADAFMKGGSTNNFIDSFKHFGRLYPNAGYGLRFNEWLMSDNSKPYNSYGNGSAMRVAPCAWYAKSLDEAEDFAKLSSSVTHNHPEGIKGAQATAAAIYMARIGKSKQEIKDYIESKYDYDLSRSLDEIRPIYKFNETCQETVPEAIIAFLESTDFEDAIRNAISLGGDSDTLTAITGSIAEAAYGIPDDIKDKALSYLDDTLRDVYDKWVEEIDQISKGKRRLIEGSGQIDDVLDVIEEQELAEAYKKIQERDKNRETKQVDFDLLLSYIPYFETVDPDVLCKWGGGEKREDGRISMPYAIYSDKLIAFIKDAHNCGVIIQEYPSELDRLVPGWQTIDIQEFVKTADLYTLQVIFTKCIRVDRFNEGALAASVINGLILALLKRMKDLYDK